MRFGLCGLNEAVDRRDEAIGDLGIEPSQNAVAMPLDGARDFLDRLEARSDRPAVPAIENELGPVSGRAAVVSWKASRIRQARAVLRFMLQSASRDRLCSTESVFRS